MELNFRPRRYKKEFVYSYTLGVFPTLELLQHQPDVVLIVYCHPRGLENSGVEKIKTLCLKHQIPFEIQDKVFQRLGAREKDYAVGIFNKTETRLNPYADHIVLIHPSGMGNLGTIMRTMLGFDFRDLAIIQPAADIYHPDTVRASMGSLFQINSEQFNNFNRYKEIYPRQFYPLMTDSNVDLQEVQFQSPYSLIFGNESSGLPEVFHSIGRSVKIKQSEKIDSLNIAISVGICLYEARRKERYC